jgi:hypothetical protein
MNRLKTIAGLCLTALLAGIAGADIQFHVSRIVSPPHAAPPPAASRVDPIAATAAAYGRSLTQAYAAAWLDGARKLDGGATVEAGLATVAKSWSTNRGELYDGQLTPVLKSIVPEGTADGDVTPAQVAKMAAAFRSIAAGLSE